MMRIAIWGDILLSNNTGMGRSVWSLLGELAKVQSKHEFTIFYSANYPHGALRDAAFLRDMSVVRVPYSRAALRMSWLVDLLPIEELVGGQDVLFNPCAYPVATREALSRSMIWDLSLVRVPDAYSFKDRTLGALSHRKLVGSSDRLLTISESARDDIEREYGFPIDRIHVAPLGTNNKFHRVSKAEVDKFRREHQLSGPYAFWAGQIQERKNVVRLVEAIALVRQTHPDLRLVLAGERGFRAEAVDEAIRRLGPAADVVFTGHLDDVGLRRAMSGASIFVFPSLYEGFGLPVIEAMSCGTPVIAASASSLPEVVGDAGLLADPYDVRALASQIGRLLDDDALREACISRGLVRAKEFTWTRMAMETLAFVEAPRLELPRLEPSRSHV